MEKNPLENHCVHERVTNPSMLMANHARRYRQVVMDNESNTNCALSLEAISLSSQFFRTRGVS